MFSRATKEKVDELDDTETAKSQDIYTNLIKEQLLQSLTVLEVAQQPKRATVTAATLLN